MLELKNIEKEYKTEFYTQRVLKGISINFRSQEFVSILGQSGSGKTTLLNIIGGLDHYNQGDLSIFGKSTKKFKNKDWDVYRNEKVGFIFQNYNLISHISIQDNVEMAMILQGTRKSERKRRSLEVLEKVGLLEHAHKKPNQLSGGQMQRVAIARALVNNPDIILADEPTGALDEETGIQIMELIQEISKDKLVIMVTHNPELAKAYTNRIIQLSDGKVISDSHSYEYCETDLKPVYFKKKTSMNYFQALRLSLNNIKTKLGRMLSISIAGSFGIIGIALILAISNGFQQEIGRFEEEALSQLPIVIDETPTFIETEKQQITTEYSDNQFIVVQNDTSKESQHTNEITEDYINYLKDIPSNDLSSVSFQYGFSLNIAKKDHKGSYTMVDFSKTGYWPSFPYRLDGGENEIIKNNYDILAGSVDDNEAGLILVVDEYNQIPKSSLKQLGFSEDKVTISFEDVLKKELKIIFNDQYYLQQGNSFRINQNVQSMYQNKNSQTLKVQAIVRGKEEKSDITSQTGIYYTNAVSNIILENNGQSKIVKKQKEKNYNLLTGETYPKKDENGRKQETLNYLGGLGTPSIIQLYPSSYEAKEQLLTYLDDFNAKKDRDKKIEYTDTGEAMVSLTKSMMSAITVVLIGFSAISLVVSSVMIGIITYISVLERTKEIGILRALGARKKDISRVFNAETFMIGLTSGVLGVFIAYLLSMPMNIIIQQMSQLENIVQLRSVDALVLVGISILLTLIAGYLPAKSASRKKPVEALQIN